MKHASRKNKAPRRADYSRLAAIPFAEIKAQILKDPGARLEYDALEPEFEVISSLIRMRIQRGMSQKELADAIGTKQPAIARIEGGYLKGISLSTLVRIAGALQAKLVLVPAEGRM
ncbi:MAG: helix-turn-helix transcriptional regulator [Deltaproteobacteria bacterium]|nr:helix-turn-helix transcriptional regulator [Deltaproteobacteria bacterium]